MTALGFHRNRWTQKYLGYFWHVMGNDITRTMKRDVKHRKRKVIQATTFPAAASIGQKYSFMLFPEMTKELRNDLSYEVSHNVLFCLGSRPRISDKDISAFEYSSKTTYSLLENRTPNLQNWAHSSFIKTSTCHFEDELRSYKKNTCPPLDVAPLSPLSQTNK